MEATHAAHQLFGAEDPATVRRALHGLVGADALALLSGDLREALRGSEAATRRYVRGYRRLTGRVLAEAHEAWPDMVAASGAGLTLADSGGRPMRSLLGVLENASVEAPFTPWVSRFELGDAVALDLTSRVRVLLGAVALAAPADRVRVDVDDIDAQRFLRRVRHHLNHPDDEDPLRRLMELFELSKSELGRLFGVSRQAIDGWLAHGVPAERQEKLAALLALADLLERKLKAGRIPGVARRPADAYGGRTMLQMIEEDRHDSLLASVRASFDWSQTA